jgi:hypothetical protein
VPSGATALNAPAPSQINWNVPFIGLKTVFRQNMPNVTQQKNFCGPGAAANSLHWLAGANGFTINQTLNQTQTELAPSMGNNNDGNWDAEEVQGKLKYIRDHNLPLEVHYTGGVTLPTNGHYHDPVTGMNARNDGAFSWAWLDQQIQMGQDVEIMTSTHWVVVESLISWDGIRLFSYRDDNYQHGAATTAAERAKLDKRRTWTYFDNGFTDIGNGREVLRAAVAESVPAPGSIMVLAAAGVAAFRRRRGSSGESPGAHAVA